MVVVVIAYLTVAMAVFGHAMVDVVVAIEVDRMIDRPSRSRWVVLAWLLLWCLLWPVPASIALARCVRGRRPRTRRSPLQEK